MPTTNWSTPDAAGPSSQQPSRLPNDEEPTQLDRPATKEDVESGKAIFSFEGLGERRVVELPEDDPPWRHDKNVPADWNRPPVCQAEELEVDGNWKRYYGVLSDQDAAVVPAEEWKIYWPDAPWVPFQENPFRPSGETGPQGFGSFGGTQIQWGMTLPRSESESSTGENTEPLTVKIHLDNSTTDPIELPAEWCKDAENGGPAMSEIVSISLQRTAFDPTFPFLRESNELEPVQKTKLPASDAPQRTVKPRETTEVFNFNLRDWYEIQDDGYYTLHVRINGRKLGLDDELEHQCSRTFTIGKPPKLPTIEQYNESLLVFGTPENEQRLKQLIVGSAEPAPAVPEHISPELEQLLAWSQPVNGLSARIEYIRRPVDRSGGRFTVRLKNESDQPLTVPSGNPCDKDAEPLFELQVQHGTGPWRPVEGSLDRFIAAPENPNAPLLDLPTTDRPWVTLQPGEDCISIFSAWNEQDCEVATAAKIVLRQPDTTVPERWSGVLETPLRAMTLSAEQALARRTALPFPKHFPPLSYNISRYVGASSEGADVDFLNYRNKTLIDMLAIYDPASVCAEFESRMREEKVLAMKLLQASIAASLGSQESALFLLEMVKDTDYYSVLNTQHALRLTCERHATSPPDEQPKQLPAWLVELCLATLSDQRFVTALDEAENVSFASTFTVASCDSGLTTALALSKSPTAVPSLIERAKRGHSDAIRALGQIGGDEAIAALSELAGDEDLGPVAFETLAEAGDPQAVPTLIELLKNTNGWKIRRQLGSFHPPLATLATSLGQQKANEAVPQLLRFVHYPEIIEFLGAIGNPDALPTLKEIVAAEGRIIRNGRPILPRLKADRYFAARMALCTWDDDHGIARLLEMLDDDETRQTRRYELVEALAQANHPDTIPALLDIIQRARGHASVQAAIAALGDLQYKTAVKGLIDSFDVDFQEESPRNGGHVTPATYHNAIAQSLHKLTGQSFGTDKQQWLNWWQQQGQHDPNLN